MNGIKGMTDMIVRIFGLLGMIGIGAALGILLSRRSGRKGRGRTASLPAKSPAGQADTRMAQGQHLRDELLRTEKRLWEIKMLSPYEKIFERSAMSFQILLGLANVSLDTLTGERRDYYMWDMILHPLVNAVKDGGGTISGGSLVMPDSGKTFAQEEMRQRISRMNAQELEGYLQENNKRIGAGEIAGQKMRAVSGLGSVIERLQELERKKAVTDEDIRAIAQKVQALLEDNGIYPMMAKDSRLGVQLKKQFIPPKKHALRYPGLFIRWGNEWEVLGANVGMDDWKE